MQQTKVSYKTVTIKLSDYDVHALVLIHGDFTPDEVDKALAQQLNFQEKPLVTEDKKILTHVRDFLIAKDNGTETMEAILMENADEHDVVHMITYKHRHNVKKNEKRLACAKFYTAYLTTNERGKEWAREIPGSKTREKVGYLIGVSDSMIQLVTDIGKENPKALVYIDQGKKTFKQAQYEIDEEQEKKKAADNNASEPEVEEQNEEGIAENATAYNGDGESDSATPGIEDDASEITVSNNLEWVSLSIEGMEAIDFSIKDHTASGTFNGDILTGLNYFYKETREKEVDGVPGERNSARHIIQLPDLSGSIHIILTGSLANDVKNQDDAK